MSLKLDIKDRKLLFELDMNARASLAELSKKTGLSKQAVLYRIDRLEKESCITGYYSVIDMGRLGNIFVRFLIKLKDTDAEKERELIEKGFKWAGWILSSDGEWDLIYVFYAKDVFEIKSLLNDFMFRHGTNVSNYEITIATNISHFPHKFLSKSKNPPAWTFSQDSKKIELDEIDLKILELISDNARISLTDMAKSLKTSYKVIGYHLKNLEKQKVILGYRANINPHALGKTHYKVFLGMQNLNEKRLNEFKNFLRYHDDVIYITEAIGFADIEFECLVDNHIQFNELMKDIRSKFSDIIRNYEVLILLKFYRINYLPKD